MDEYAGMLKPTKFLSVNKWQIHRHKASRNLNGFIIKLQYKQTPPPQPWCEQESNAISLVTSHSV